MRKSFAGAMAVVGLACGAPTSGTAATVEQTAAVQGYTFAGTCSDCDGTGYGVLTLQGYTPGEEITDDNFVSFTYSSNLVSTAFDRSELAYIQGDLETLPGPNYVTFGSTEEGNYFDFFSTSGGFWCLGYGLACTADYGGSHVWDVASSQGSVPEPLTWALMVSGFGLVGTQVRAARRAALA